MTAADYGPDGPPPEEDPDELVQMNVRVPRSHRDRIDARRAPLGMSRDKWILNATTWALEQPTRDQALRATSRTTQGTTRRAGRRP